MITAYSTKCYFNLSKWDDILVLGAQLDPFPLGEHDEVSTQTVIGKSAKKPLILNTPIFVTEELKTFAMITGHKNLSGLNIDDLCTINNEISQNTSISHA